MKTQLLRWAGIALVFAIFGSSAMAVGPVPSLLQTSGDSHCQHVLNLLMRYGTSNHAHRLAVPFGNSLVLGDTVGDLELVSVTLVDPGSDVAGPTVAVAVRNNSERHVTSFSATAVAVLGRIHPFSPSKTCTIDKICAGETLEIQLQLPIEALAMGRAGANLLAFKKLVIAIDSFDELVECDESNNILVLDRTQIPVAAAAAPQVQETVPAPEAAIPSTPGAEDAPSEVQPIPVDPTVKNTPSIDDIDFDDLVE